MMAVALGIAGLCQRFGRDDATKMLYIGLAAHIAYGIWEIARVVGRVYESSVSGVLFVTLSGGGESTLVRTDAPTPTSRRTLTRSRRSS